MGRIVGRGAELTALKAAVGQARGGRSRTLVIEGEAGVGKTTLLEATAVLARQAGFGLARGAAVELEADRPFGPFVAALDLDVRSKDPRRKAVAGVVIGRTIGRATGGIAASVPDARYRAVDAICALVDALVEEQPLALLVDDLHWADEPTLLALRRLSRVTGVPLLLVVTTRPAAPLGLVAATIDSAIAAGGARMTVAPLARADTTTLVADLVGGTPGPRLISLADGAGGNPLFLSELVAVLRQDHSLRTEGDVVDVADGADTADLARRLRARAARLGSEANALVRVGAVLGSFTLDEAARAGGWALADLVEPLEELLRAGLLLDDGGMLSFRHDLLRKAIEDEMPPTARRALHTAAGQALAATGASPIRIARHLALGAVPGDHDAVVWLHKAAQVAAEHGPGTAVRLLDDALALVSPNDPYRLDLLTDRVEALGWSGRNAEAEALARELLDRVEDRDARLTLRRQLALALFIANRSADAAEECDRAASECADDPAAHALALAEGALACIAGAQLERATSLTAQALAIGRLASAPAAVALALSVRSRLLAFEGRWQESLDAARQGMDEAVADVYGDVDRYQPGLFAIFTLSDLDRFSEAADLLRVERARAEQQGIVWAIPLHHAAAANRHLLLGELADAYAEATAGLTVSEDSGATLPVTWLHAVLALVALHRGDSTAAASHLAAGEASMAATTPLLGTDLFALAQARLAETSRDLVGATGLLVGAWDLFGALGVMGGQRHIGVDAVRAAARAGDANAVDRMATRMAEIAAATGVASDHASALFAAGVLANDADLLLEALAAFEPGIQPLKRVLVAEEAARSLWGSGRVDEAAKVLDDARQSCFDCGANADARRVGELFAALGIRRQREPVRPTTGWGSLTVTERRIVELVGTGAPNASIAGALGISRRTVETHLRHVYAKVGVASRVQLALEAARRDPA